LPAAFSHRWTDQAAGVDTAYRLAYGRHPNGAEKDVVLTFLAKQKLIVADAWRQARRSHCLRPCPRATIAPPGGPGRFLSDAAQLHEFVYRN